MNPPASKKDKDKPSFTWAQATRDIVVTSINRGQLPILGMIAVALLVLYRLPEGDVGKIALEVIESLKRGELWAYLVELATVIAWYVHSRAMRKAFSEEAERIGREKSRVQSQAAGVEFKSSNRSGNRKREAQSK
jgi:hypothetical protein